jgi:hypothetical protein
MNLIVRVPSVPGRDVRNPDSRSAMFRPSGQVRRFRDSTEARSLSSFILTLPCFQSCASALFRPTNN